MAQKKQKNYEMNMCEGPIFKNMVVFMLGVLGTLILQQFFNTADMFVVGRFGHPGALASVSSTSSITNLFINIFVGLSIGAGIVVAKYYGAKSPEKVKKCLHTSVALSLIAGIILAFIVWFLAPSILKEMDTPTENNVLSGAITYMRIYFIGVPFMLLYNFSAAILRAVGDSKRTLFYIIQAGIINIVLNLVFVLIFDMNVAGVALATTISQAYSAIKCLICFLNYDGVLKLSPKEIKIDIGTLSEIAKIGIPSGIQSSLFSISNVLIQSSVNSFGAFAIEGAGASSGITSYLFFITNAVCNTATNFTSQNYGAQKPDRIKKVAFISLTMAFVLCLFFGILFSAFADPLLKIFTKNDVALEYGKTVLLLISLPCFLCGLQDTTTGLLRGIFKPLPAMISSILGICVFRIVWLKTAFILYPSFEVIYYSYPISWLLSFVVLIILFIYYFKSAFSKKGISCQTQ